MADATEGGLPPWVVDLLIGHYSAGRKLSHADAVKLAEVDAPTLKTPPGGPLFRGIAGVSTRWLRGVLDDAPDEDGEAVEVLGETDEDRDVSWTDDIDEAVKFAGGVYTTEDPNDRRWLAVVETPSASRSSCVLNPDLLAEVPEIADWFHEVWGETLKRAILKEREVAATKALPVSRLWYARDLLTLARLVAKEPPMVEKRLDDLKIELPICKVDEDRRLVYGVVLEPNVKDAQNEWERPETIERVAHRFLARFNRTTELGVQHSIFGEIGVELVESYIAPQDLDFDGELATEDVIRKGSWVFAVHVSDDALWRSVKEGGITGFSIGGVATVYAKDA